MRSDELIQVLARKNLRNRGGARSLGAGMSKYVFYVLKRRKNNKKLTNLYKQQYDSSSAMGEDTCLWRHDDRPWVEISARIKFRVARKA